MCVTLSSVVFPWRTFYLIADSSEDCDQWLSMLASKTKRFSQALSWNLCMSSVYIYHIPIMCSVWIMCLYVCCTNSVRCVIIISQDNASLEVRPRMSVGNKEIKNCITYVQHSTSLSLCRLCVAHSFCLLLGWWSPD